MASCELRVVSNDNGRAPKDQQDSVPLQGSAAKGPESLRNPGDMSQLPLGPLPASCCSLLTPVFRLLTSAVTRYS